MIKGLFFETVAEANDAGVLRVGTKVLTNGDNDSIDNVGVKGVIGVIEDGNIYIYQNEDGGIGDGDTPASGTKVKGYKHCFAVELDNKEAYIVIEGKEKVALLPGAPTIGRYEVSSINATGFHVGCQKVTWKEYDAIGKLRPKTKAKPKKK